MGLEVKRHTDYVLQPSFRLRVIEENMTEKWCYAPNLYVGYLANIPIGGANTFARFIEAPSNLFFNIPGEQVTTNQLILGLELYAQRLKSFEFTANFEADLLSHLEVYTAKIKLQWLF